MPELPDITIYLEALDRHICGEILRGIRIVTPFVLRTVAPGIAEVTSRRVVGLRRIGKRIVFGVEGGRFIVVHLMIAGRFRWDKPGAKLHRKLALAAFDFERGTLVLTEAGSKRRASIHLVEGDANLQALDPGGVDVLAVDLAAFRGALVRENHTVKRALTDPHLFSGIGNAYSDEILHRAGLSPVKLTSRLTEDEISRLHEATRGTLSEWIERLRSETGEGFPEKVTAFREEMAVHGKFGEPCPVCIAPVQRIVYADNETNYCARCQTGGRRLADRALSRLLREDWPRSIDDVE